MTQIHYGNITVKDVNVTDKDHQQILVQWKLIYFFGCKQRCLQLLGDTWRWHKIMLSHSIWVVGVIAKYYILLLWRQFAIDVHCDVTARDCFGMSDRYFFKTSHSQLRWMRDWQPETHPQISLLIATNSYSNCNHNSKN